MTTMKIRNLHIITNHISGNKSFEYSGDFSCGDRIAIMGPSGCGKSTFLKTIAKLSSKINTHSLSVDYESIECDAPNFEYAYLPQDSKDIVRPWHKVKKQINFDPDDKLGLQSIMERYPRDLSGGELRRVAIGHVLSLAKKKLYLLDEPFNGLDKDVREKAILHVLDKIDNESLLIFVTHYIEEVEMIKATVLIDIEPQEVKIIKT